jgi:hypothetical protein
MVFIPSGRIRRWTDRKGNNKVRAGGWYLGPGRTGKQIELKMDSSVSFDFDTLIVPTFKLINNWGSLGAKSQNGFGVVDIKRKQGNEYVTLQTKDIQPEYYSKNKVTEMLPNLTDMFFCKICFQPRQDSWWENLKEIQFALKGIIPDGNSVIELHNQITNNHIEQWLEQGCFPLSPSIKNWLRYELFESLNNVHSDYIFGGTKTICPWCYQYVNKNWDKHYNCGCDLKKHQPIERIRSKIGVSFAYQTNESWEVRIWGWLPSQQLLDKQPLQLGLDRENDFIKPLFESLKPGGSFWISGPMKNIADVCDPWIWREFKSDRDNTTDTRWTDPYEYFDSLLKETTHV